MWANTPRACLMCAWLCVLIFLQEHNATACACLCMRGVRAAFLLLQSVLCARERSGPCTFYAEPCLALISAVDALPTAFDMGHAGAAPASSLSVCY